MSRKFLCWPVAALVLAHSPVPAATRADHGTLVYENIPEAPAALTESLAGYLSGRQATPLGWSPKGALLVSTRFGDVDQLHVVELEAGAREQITFLREPVGQAAFSPDPLHNALCYLADRGGDGAGQIYYQKLGGGAAAGPAKLLTDGKAVNGAPVWSNSGRSIAFFTTARDGLHDDIDVVEPDTGMLPHLALAGTDGAWYPLDWSPDDGKLLVLNVLSPADSQLYVVDLSTGQKREVDPAPGRVAITGARFARDGRGVYLLSNRDSEFVQLRYVNLFTPERAVLSERGAGDVEELAVSRDGHYLAYTRNEGGLSKLEVLDLRARQNLAAPRLPAPGVIDHLAFDPDGRRLAFAFAPANRPRDAYVLDLTGNRVSAWTRSELGAVDPDKLVTPRLAQFPTFDRLEGHARSVPAYVYEPPGGGTHPVLIVLHDGPAAQARPTFDPWIQFVAGELGWAVVAPNLRGSAGYGKTYLGLDVGPQRDDVIKDLGALIVWVDTQNGFDPRHVVVSGAGYGGYLALSALVNYSDRLSGAVDLGGISDLVSYLAGAAPRGQGARRAQFGDERDPDTRSFLRRLSPLSGADRITRPLLVVHGRNDADVPPSESDQMVNRLRGRGPEVWYLQAADEGADFRRQHNREAYYAAFAQFLKSLR